MNPETSESHAQPAKNIVYRATRGVLEIEAFDGEFNADMVRYVARGEPARNLHVNRIGHYYAWFEREADANAWLLQTANEDIAKAYTEIDTLKNLVALLEAKEAAA